MSKPLTGPEPTPQTTLKGVVGKIQAIAATEYNGFIYNNIFAIYNKLDPSEQMILLRGFIGLFLVFELTAVESVVPLENFREQERVRLQMFIVKFLLIFLGVVVLGALGLMYLFGLHVFDGSELVSLFEGFLKLLKVVMGV